MHRAGLLEKINRALQQTEMQAAHLLCSDRLYFTAPDQFSALRIMRSGLLASVRAPMISEDESEDCRLTLFAYHRLTSRSMHDMQLTAQTGLPAVLRGTQSWRCRWAPLLLHKEHKQIVVRLERRQSCCLASWADLSPAAPTHHLVKVSLVVVRIPFGPAAAASRDERYWTCSQQARRLAGQAARMMAWRHR